MGSLKKADHALSEARLKEYAKFSQEIRMRFMEAAKAEDDALNLAYAEASQNRGSAANELSRKYTRRTKAPS